MRYLSLGVLLAAALLLPVAALSPPHRSPSPALPALPTGSNLRVLLLVVPATGGLLLSPDGGRHWGRPAGLPSRGSFASLVADASRQGSAFAANGDVYMTRDGGYTWSRLALPAWASDTAGVTVLAGDPAGGTLYAGGAAVLSYDDRQGWRSWGRGWPTGAVVTGLLATPDHALYAAAGDRLYVAPGAAVRWLAIPTSPWRGAPVSAMTLGPDGQTPYIAVRGDGVWYVAGRSVAALNNVGLPSGALVYALASDPVAEDLYAATNRGLFVRHQPGSDEPSNRNLWHPVAGIERAPIVALRPLEQGTTLLAAGRDGTLYVGRHDRSQTLAWRQVGRFPAQSGAFVVAALAGAEWQGKPPPLLPTQFAGPCVPDGRTIDQAHSICGPFRSFYLGHGGSSVLGFPNGPAQVASDGRVTQTFEKVRLQWTLTGGVRLAPLGPVLAGHAVFPRPTVAQALAANTVYYKGGYYVDPLFYAFWRAYQYPDGTSIFGPPISQRVYRPSSNASGQRVPVQYFENVALEYHADSPEPIQLSYLPKAQQGM